MKAFIRKPNCSSAVRADAYDMVCNGIEVGGGSIRIHDAQLQAKMFEILGFTPEKAEGSVSNKGISSSFGWVNG